MPGPTGCGGPCRHGQGRRRASPRLPCGEPGAARGGYLGSFTELELHSACSVIRGPKAWAGYIVSTITRTIAPTPARRTIGPAFELNREESASRAFTPRLIVVPIPRPVDFPLISFAQ